jgi:uncharacterized membrane protein YgdD (TMEM256/DUF423 family)
MGWTLWIAVGSIWGCLAVVFGAFGAHALKDRLTPELLQTFELATKYQMYHALALIAVGLLGTRVDTVSLQVAGWAFLAGSLVFSGSLYILTLSGMKWLGMITPVGGLGMICGWIALAYTAISMRGDG